jgi:hypothetical protein
MRVIKDMAVSEGCCIGTVGGLPTLMAGRAPLPAPVFCLMHDQALRDEVVGSLYRSGIRAFAVRTMVGVGAGPQTDRSIDRLVTRLANVARMAPDAWLLADCDFFPSETWMLDNPHEGFITADSQILVLGKDGDTDRREYIQVPGPAFEDVAGGTLNGEDARVLYGRRRVSPFSERFAREACRSVRLLQTAAAERGFGKRLCGIFLGCYICGEWNLHMFSPDHGRAAVRGFRRFLRARYQTDQALQAAWADPFATLPHALPPREHADLNLAPMILASQRHADYRSAEARALAEQFRIMALGVKRLDPGWIVGGFFPGANPPQTDWRRLAQDPAVDFLSTPIAYENRGPGSGVGSQSPFCDGFSALGKVWFDELDTRTVIAGPADERYGRAHTVPRSVDLLWRDAGQMLIRGHHGWWLDFGNKGEPPYSWHLVPEILRFHRQFSTLWQDVASLDRRPPGEIKVFIPSDAARHFQILGPLDVQRHTEWTLLGAPFECEVLENLLEGRTEPGRLNILHGVSHLPGPAMKALKKRLKGYASFVVWVGGAGLLEEGRIADESRSGGLVPLLQRFSLLSSPEEPEAAPTPEAAEHLGIPDTLLLGQHYRLFTSGFAYSSAKLNVPMKRIAVTWKLQVTDPAAIPLARRTTDQSVVAAMKTDEDGTTHVVYNLPVLNTVFLRALARKAGCHLYTQSDDVIYASRGLVLIHATYSGVHRLAFPGDPVVFDLRHGEPVRTRDGAIELDLKKGETRLYRTAGDKPCRV